MWGKFYARQSAYAYNGPSKTAAEKTESRTHLTHAWLPHMAQLPLASPPLQPLFPSHYKEGAEKPNKRQISFVKIFIKDNKTP